MIYHRVTFSRGRSGDGYLEIDDNRMAATRLLTILGTPITDANLEYHILDTSPLWLLWMIVGLL